MLESRECPYTETRLSVNTRITTLETNFQNLCRDLWEQREELRQEIHKLAERIEKIGETVSALYTKNNIQDNTINSIQTAIKEKEMVNRWTIDKIITIISSILSPIIVSLIVSSVIHK